MNNYNTYQFFNHHNKKFNSLLWKIFYPYEYMDNFVKFHETSLPEKEDFCSYLNMEYITDADYEHTKRVWNKKI